ncbi:MAG TPA: hypothetical protein VHX67_03850 [Acidimicrobiales bacterium]|nr:hypothetical protein [Acidimicrobiales bacterium]
MPRARRIVAGMALATAGIPLNIASHWGQLAALAGPALLQRAAPDTVAAR